MSRPAAPPQKFLATSGQTLSRSDWRVNRVQEPQNCVKPPSPALDRYVRHGDRADTAKRPERLLYDVWSFFKRFSESFDLTARLDMYGLQ
jgi:hypothetical protein